jgi:hypothetical protein
MKPKTPTAILRQLNIASRARRAWLGAAVVTLLMPAIQAQQAPSNVAGSWHVAVPGWGIDDHLLEVNEHGGALHGKFEFADVKGTVAGRQIKFDVTDASGRLLISFEGTISGDTMKGAVTSPADGPLVQHGAARTLTTEWTAHRETTAVGR